MEVEIAHSDYLDVRERHPDTRLMVYSNKIDYEGVIYSVEPPPVFMMRVHSKFFKPRKPEENEKEELSDGITVKLLGTIKKQRLLQIEPQPPYRNYQIGLILQHSSLYLGNVAFVKEGTYDTDELDEVFSRESGQAWLTENKPESF